MTINVERGWNDTFRLTFRGQREVLHGTEWTRKIANTALNLYSNVYGLKRSNIRFKHH